MNFEQMKPANELVKSSARRLNCDQVAWMLNAIDRYLPPDSKDTLDCCKQREMKKYGLLYEIMDAANLVFGDISALRNGTPFPARKFYPEIPGVGSIVYGNGDYGTVSNAPENSTVGVNIPLEERETRGVLVYGAEEVVAEINDFQMDDTTTQEHLAMQTR